MRNCSKDDLTMAINKRKSDNATQTGLSVLVGTYRKDNAEWIKERKLYNLPLPSSGMTTFHERIERVVLIAEGFSPLAFEAKFREVVNVDWLKECDLFKEYLRFLDAFRKAEGEKR